MTEALPRLRHVSKWLLAALTILLLVPLIYALLLFASGTVIVVELPGMVLFLAYPFLALAVAGWWTNRLRAGRLRTSLRGLLVFLALVIASGMLVAFRAVDTHADFWLLIGLGVVFILIVRSMRKGDRADAPVVAGDLVRAGRHRRVLVWLSILCAIVWGGSYFAGAMYWGRWYAYKLVPGTLSFSLLQTPGIVSGPYVVPPEFSGRGTQFLPSLGWRRLVLPLWLPFLFVATPAFILWRRDRRARRSFCRTCLYNLTGNTSGTCPECGRPTTKNRQVTE